ILIGRELTADQRKCSWEYTIDVLDRIAASYQVVRVPLMIEARDYGIRIKAGGRICSIVLLAICRVVECRIIRHESFRDRVNAVSRDDVSRKRLPRQWIDD